jgi:hypothetical protein
MAALGHEAQVRPSGRNASYRVFSARADERRSRAMPFRYRNLRLTIVAAVVGALSFGTAYAQGATADQSGATLTADCAGGFATLNGSVDSITFRNACQTLTVNGSGDTIQQRRHHSDGAGPAVIRATFARRGPCRGRRLRRRG